ncbi:HAAS signaling domain-containing protein [Cellulomonas timonensis]|uniref:HAAS signaling domain-containing protein n=1 Tax=Cellulomonas timonensis TaxID=1689271 RepID=UPI00082C1796|nr:hypothetical protein [Cellulomonas timonensis]
MTAPHLPLVEAYLEDLDRALAGIDPAERADVVASIREHVDESLGEAPTSEDVQDVLRRLGPVERIAREADVAGPALLSPTATVPHRVGHPARSGPALLVLAALSLALIPAMPVVAVALALAVGIAALLGARRTDGPTGLLRAAAALAALAILITGIAAATLLSARTELPSIEAPVEVVSPGGG